MKLTHELVLKMSLAICVFVFEKAKELNIDWSKTVFEHVEKQEKYYPGNKAYEGGPGTVISMNILFSQEQRNYSIKISQLYFVDNDWKITGYMELKEVK